MMKSIDKLREYARVCTPNARSALSDIADAIEQELADRYVELPSDADGVPIHVGDKLTDDAMRKSEGKVCRLMLDSDGWYIGFSRLGWDLAKHHKWHYQQPDSWERIIADAYMRGAHEQYIEENRVIEVSFKSDYDLVARCKALARQGA